MEHLGDSTKPLGVGAQRKTVHVVNFSHLDLSWLGTQEECLSRGGRILAEAIQRAKASPAYRFHVEYVMFLAHYLTVHPEILPEVCELVKSGRIEVGAQWIGMHTAYQPGENWARNLLYAQHWLRARFGRYGTALMLSDLPDHSPQIPQLLAKSGVRFLVMTRMGPRNQRLFRWKGLDGTGIIVWSTNPEWNAYGGYGWSLYRGLAESWEVMERLRFLPEMHWELEVCPSPHYLLHAGNDLVRPFPALEANLNTLNARTPWHFRLSTLREFYDAVVSTDIPTLEGEIPCAWPYLEARYAEHFQWEQVASARLVAAEVLASLAHVVRGYAYPADCLAEAWQGLLAAEDHNYGCQGAKDGDSLKLEGRRNAEQVGRRLGRQALAVLAESVSLSRRQAVPVVVFNPLPWTRTALVRAHFTFYWAGLRRAWDLGDRWPTLTPEPELGTLDPIEYAKRHEWKAEQFSVVDDARVPVAFQILSDVACETRDVECLFMAEHVPGCGYRTYYIVPEPSPDFPAAATVAREPARLRAIAEQCTLDVQLDRSLVRIQNRWGEIECQVRIVGEAISSDNQNDDIQDGRSWDLVFGSADLIEHGPVRTRIRITGGCPDFRDLRITIDFSLLAGEAWCDLDIDITCPTSIPGRVELIWSPAAGTQDNWYGVPFGANTTRNVMEGAGPQDHDAPPRINRTSWERTRIVQQWIDVGDRSAGTAVVSNRHLFVFEAGQIHAVLCRCRTPLAHLRASFRLWPHAGDWREACVPRAAAEFEFPVEAYTVNDAATPKSLPETHSFVAIESRGVVLSAFKRAEDGKALILRLYETLGRREVLGLRINLPVRRVFRSTILEEAETEVDLATLTIEPFEILTLRLEL